VCGIRTSRRFRVALRKTERPSEALATTVRVVRERRRWNQQELADRLAELGTKMDRATVARTESLARGISLDEAFTLCAALGIAPVFAFFPHGHGTQVEIAPELTVDAGHAQAWLRGELPLRREDERVFMEEVPEREWILQRKGLADLLPLVRAFEDAALSENAADLDRFAELIVQTVNHAKQWAKLAALSEATKTGQLQREHKAKKPAKKGGR
jgi:transcriptional regulator with XRE-family HTH domain